MTDPRLYDAELHVQRTFGRLLSEYPVRLIDLYLAGEPLDIFDRYEQVVDSLVAQASREAE